MGGQRHSKSFSFGGPSGFSFSDVFSNIFGSGMNEGNQFGGFRGSGSPNSRFNSPVDIEDVDPQFFDKQIRDRGMTWILLFYTPSARGYHVFESIMEDVTGLLSGAVKAGRINCLKEQAFCKDLGVKISGSARLFLYSYRNSDHGSLVEYSGEADTRSLKSFCQEQLPRFSKRVDLDQFDIASAAESLPQLLLLSTKKDTPVIWRVLSGLYRKRFLFYNAEVRDVTDPTLRRLGVDALPAVVGRMALGEIHILKAGISVKDLRSGIDELKPLVEDFGRKSKRAASSRAKKPSQTETQGPSVPYLTSSNFGGVCGDKTAVCIIGVFRSLNARERLKVILSAASQKTLVRRQNHAWASENSVSYSLLDAEKQSAFLSAFDKSAYRSVDKLLIAFKPRKGKFAAFTGEFSMEEVEKFISSVINGDVRFSPIRQKPVLK